MQNEGILIPIRVLGVQWKIEIIGRQDETMKALGLNGYCDESTKYIKVWHCTDTNIGLCANALFLL